VEKRTARGAGAPSHGAPPFKPAKVPQTRDFPGSLYGTAGKVYLDTDSAVAGGPKGEPRRSADPAADRIKGKKNLYVNPPKRGGYGYSTADRAIGGPLAPANSILRQPPGGDGDVYQPGLAMTRAARKEARAKFVGGKPFSSGGRCPDVFAKAPLFADRPETAPAAGTSGSGRGGSRPASGAAAGRITGRPPFRPVRPPGMGDRNHVISTVGRDYRMESEFPEKPPPGKPLPATPFVPAGISGSLYTKDINPHSRPEAEAKGAIYIWEGGK